MEEISNICTLVTNYFCANSSVILCLFTSSLHNLGNKYKNNPLVSVETVRHSSSYITCIMGFCKTLLDGRVVLY